MSLLTLPNLLSWSAQVAAIAAAALVTIKLVRLDAPAVRYLMLRIVLAVCLLLPFVQPYRAMQPEQAPRPARATAAPTRSPLTASAPRATDQPLATVSVGLWPALLTLIVAGAAARFAWIGVGVVRLRRLRRAGVIAPIADDLVEIQSIVRTTATIRYVEELGQPVTFGFRSPIVLLPESLRAQPETIRRAVLAHELWHVRRRDWMWTVCEESVRAIFWFHPGVWMLLSAIQSAREEVVDELAIMSTGSRRNYLNALLTYADRPPLLAATAFARRRHLMYRVMLISKEAVMSARRVVASGAVLAAAVLSVGYHSIHAFPMTDTAAPQSVDDRGPLERRARPISPENPVPRRTFSVPAEYPTEAEQLGLRGTVTVRITVDETGRVAETRAVGFRFASGASGTQPPRRAQDDSQQASRAMMTAATMAVGQWLYAAPAEGPLSFSVNIPVGPADDPPPPPPPPPPPTVRGAAVPPPPPPPPPPGVTTGWQYSDGTARVGGEIKAPYKTHHVAPVYPSEARAARIQGIVILEARIEPNGRVSEARVIRSVPALDDAAVEAVLQWHFTPTVVDGVAIPVVMVTTVNFTLQ